MDKGRIAMMMVYVAVVYGLLVAVAWSLPESLRLAGVYSLAAVSLVAALAVGIARNK